MSDYMGSDFGAGDAFDLRGPILTDTPCRRCGYNLRGLQQTGRCPECGVPAGVSVCGDLLRFSHPRWLRQVAEGLNMILWGMVISFVVRLGAQFVFKNEPAIAQFLITIGSMVGAWGTWQMTIPDPSGIGETGGINARRMVRAAVVAGLAASIAQWLALAGRTSSGELASLFLFLGVCTIVTIIGEFAKLQYIVHLADRIPDAGLSSRANGLKWGLAVCYGLMAILGLIAAAAIASSFSSLSPNRGMPNGAGLGAAAAAGCLMIPAAIAVLVMAIMTVVLIYRMGQAIRQQVPIAIQIWSRAAAAVDRQANPSVAPAPPAQDMRPRF